MIRGERCLFKDLAFALEPGELLFLEGANGSGKTSLLRVIAGLATPESGEVAWNGEPIYRQRQTYHGEIVWLSHRTGLKGDLTLIDNLAFEAALRPQSSRQLMDVCETLDIAHLKQLPLRALSAGQQRRVALARLLLAEAPLWFMDEPITNLDRDGQSLVRSVLASHLDSGGMCAMAAHQNVEIDASIQRVSL